MKRIIGLTLLNLILITAKAQTNDVIKITGTKFPFDIMQQWIDAYSKTHPGALFSLSKTIPTDSADLLIAAHGFRPGELTDDQVSIAVNQYAQLPVVNDHRADLKALQTKGFTKEDLQDIYFQQKANKQDHFNTKTNVYKREKNVCASRSFAENVTGTQSDVAGVNVNGDDKALLDAVKKDVNGISYNNLGLVYDINTRKVADSIAIIPMDLNGNGKIDANENIYRTLDDVLNYLSKNSSTLIPQDNVNIVISKSTFKPEALRFLNWILTQGQSYNLHFGFMNLKQEIVARGQQTINNLLKETAKAK